MCNRDQNSGPRRPVTTALHTFFAGAITEAHLWQDLKIYRVTFREKERRFIDGPMSSRDNLPQFDVRYSVMTQRIESKDSSIPLSRELMTNLDRSEILQGRSNHIPKQVWAPCSTLRMMCNFLGSRWRQRTYTMSLIMLSSKHKGNGSSSNNLTSLNTCLLIVTANFAARCGCHVSIESSDVGLVSAPSRYGGF
jgi:hypothetical protein